MTNQSTITTAPEKKSRPRGFAAMNPERVREISRLGGKAAHVKGVAHEFTREEAQAAGRKGGLAAHQHDAHRREIAVTPEPIEAVAPPETIDGSDTKSAAPRQLPDAMP
jgi:general stress protein YciG